MDRSRAVSKASMLLVGIDCFRSSAVDPGLVSPISNIWFRYRPFLIEQKLQSCIIKGRQPNEGYTTLVRKFEKRSRLSHL